MLLYRGITAYLHKFEFEWPEFIRNYAEPKYRSLKWGGLLGFYSGNYLVFCVVGQLGINDLRFGMEFTFSENASSVVAVLLVAF